MTNEQGGEGVTLGVIGTIFWRRAIAEVLGRASAHFDELSILQTILLYLLSFCCLLPLCLHHKARSLLQDDTRDVRRSDAWLAGGRGEGARVVPGCLGQEEAHVAALDWFVLGQLLHRLLHTEPFAFPPW